MFAASFVYELFLPATIRSNGDSELHAVYCNTVRSALNQSIPIYANAYHSRLVSTKTCRTVPPTSSAGYAMQAYRQ